MVEDNDAILHAREEIDIEGMSVRLNAFPGRDLMPSPNPDPSMGAVLQVVECSSGKPVDGITGLRAWFVSENDVWPTSISGHPAQVGGIEFWTSNGPCWDVERVGLVLEFEDWFGARHLLIARNRAVFTTH